MRGRSDGSQVVWLTAGAKKKDHHEGVSLSDSTGHGKEIEDISSRAGEIAREAKDKAEHVTGADKGPISKEFAGNKFDDASKAVQGMGEKVEQRVGETYEEAKRRVEESMSTARDSVDSVKQKVGHAAEEARDMLPGAKKKVEEATEEASERVRESTPDSSKVKAAAEDGLERAESKVREGVDAVKGQTQRFDTGDVEGKVKRGAADVEKRAKSLAADAEAKAREGADVARKAMVKGARDERTTKEQLVETQE